MVETRAAVDPSGDASWATFGVVIAISGVVTVGLGLVLAAEFPVLASVLVGLPIGLVGWMGVREAFARSVELPPPASGQEGTDDEAGDASPAGAP